ncbi:MAG: hypothetical protein K2Q18_09930, partial [Bdellovibrionales bacterium]|nr:hypothetical protein [Bdellovibrionales bacterium]
MNKLLRPVLIENKDMQDVAFKTNMENIKEQVVKLLLYSPKFGDQVIKLGVQHQMDSMNGITKFFAKALYGGDSLQWEKVRMTKDGKKAEEFIRDNVLLPKFKGIEQTTAEKKKINAEAEKLVKKAVKSYG